MSNFDKDAFLKGQKESALNSAMYKTASFNGSIQGVYPSPYLNLSDMQLPKSTIETFKWCKYYYTFDPLIAGAINSLATFPVTEIMIEDDNDQEDDEEDLKMKENVKLYKKVLFKNLNIYKLLIEIGIDYFLYGNCFLMGEMKGNSKGEKEWANIVRLDPSKMVIDYNPATGDKTYRWSVPNKIKQIVRSKKPESEYNKIPQMIKDAVIKNKTIVLNPDYIYHFNRATDSMGSNAVWGVPVVANVLKLLMYRNILRQAQEAIAREHIVPMRIYYLDRTNLVDIQADWNKTATDLAAEIKKSVRDPNYKVVSPVPVNVINVGGEGRSLLLTPEIDQIQSEILAGMNVPREFIFGGVNYSGSSISLRILENQFSTYRLLLEDFVQNFVIRKMAKARGEWLTEDDDDKLVTIKFADLKMQDDVQQKQLVVQLNGAGKCSNDYLWKAFGIDPEKMKQAIERETLEAQELQGKAQKRMLEMQLENLELEQQIELKRAENQLKIQMMQQQMQMQMQNAMMQQQQTQVPQGQEAQPQQPSQEQEAQPQQGPSEQEIDEQTQKVALQLVKQPKEVQDQMLSTLPAKYQALVRNKIKELSAESGAQGEVDMRPMPEKKPPRRDSAK